MKALIWALLLRIDYLLCVCCSLSNNPPLGYFLFVQAYDKATSQQSGVSLPKPHFASDALRMMGDSRDMVMDSNIKSFQAENEIAPAPEPDELIKENKLETAEERAKELLKVAQEFNDEIGIRMYKSFISLIK